ncbi:unnamed protein product [Amoebophrya sp. A120]|nr:unnamed protein product [Amoebophrya sp. A120]|eukprot:GSA120T00002982001.1
MRKISLALLGLTALETKGQSSSSSSRRAQEEAGQPGTSSHGKKDEQEDAANGRSGGSSSASSHAGEQEHDQHQAQHPYKLLADHKDVPGREDRGLSTARFRRAARRLREDDARAGKEESSIHTGISGEEAKNAQDVERTLYQEHEEQIDPSIFYDDNGNLLEESEIRRRLATQPFEKDWNWLSGTTARIGTGSYVASGSSIFLKATTDMSLVNRVDVKMSTGNYFSTSKPNPTMKFIAGTATARTQCVNGANGRNVVLGSVDTSNNPSFGSETHPLPCTLKDTPAQPTRATNEDTAINNKISFMHGGTYRLCFAPDGNFGTRTDDVTSYWLTNPVVVEGVSSTCATQNCLKAEPWYCWSAGHGEYVQGAGNVNQYVECQISFVVGNKRAGWDLMMLSGATSKMTWTQLFAGETYHSGNGTVDTPATERACASGDPEGGIWDYTSMGGFTNNGFLDVTSSIIGKMPRVGHNRFGSYTVRLCYCPNYKANNAAASNCGLQNDYIQSFGILYIWRMNICDSGNAETNDGADCRDAPYFRVLPHIRFVPQLSCPMGGGCHANSFNRIAFVDIAPTNDRNFWDSNAGCATTGQTESTKAVWPAAGMTRTLSGGSRQDYKAWATSLPRLDIATNEKLDVCYCNGATVSDCNTPSNWFRIGHVVGGHFNLAFKGDSTGSGTAAESMSLIQVVGKQGMLGFVGGYKTAPFITSTSQAATSEANANRYVSRGDGPRYSDIAIVKLMSYDTIGMISYQGTMRTIEAYYSYDKTTPSDKSTKLDTHCQSSSYSTDLVTGPGTSATAQTYHAVANATDENEASAYFSFTGANKDLQMTVKKAGTIAICFCGIVNEAASPWNCNKNWRFAGLLMIAGPLGTQTWNLPTKLVSKLTVRGAGMTAGDILRLVPQGTTCAGNVAPSPTYKTGCPSVEGTGCITGTNCPNTADGTSCRVAGMTGINGGLGSYLSLQNMRKSNMSPATGIYRVRADYSTNTMTVLEFNQVIQGRGLENGDTIIIDKADIKFVTDTAYTFAQWKSNSRMREAADVFTNDYAFMDKSDATNYGTATNAMGWKITFFDHTGIAATDKGKFISIPLPWSGEFGVVSANIRYPFVIEFAGGSGGWSRTNVIRTNTEIKGIEQTGDISGPLNVCWGRLNSGTPEFYQSAGEVSFFHPNNMTSAMLSLTSSAESVTAPAIITFQTSGLRTEYATYSVGKSHKLVLRFLDTIKFEAYRNSELPSHTSAIAALAGSTFVYEADAKQSVCGQLFVELWSSDSEGFPFPKGCYYSGKYTDLEEGGGETTWREFTIIFEKSSGIKHICHDDSGAAIACEYQMVIYGQPKPSLVQGGNYVDIYTKCDGCATDGSDIIFESGATVLNVDAPLVGGVPSTQPQAGNSDPGIEEFKVIYDSGAAFRDLGVGGRYATFDVRMVAKSVPRAIKSENVIRFYLMPLLQWSLSATTSTVRCMDHFSGLISYKCGAIGSDANPTLSATNVALAPQTQNQIDKNQNARRNSIKIVMPANMKDFVTDQTTHILKFVGLETPKSGFFNKRWGIQLSKKDDTAPSWSWTNGFFLKEPDVGQSSGRVVINGQTGYGPKPFKGESGNMVYVRMQLGATIWNNGKPDAGTFTLKLPAASGKAYTCSVEQAAGMRRGEVPTDLPPFYDFDQDGYLDANFGVLGTHTTEGYWAAQSGPDCDYFLNSYQTIHAGQVFYIALTVKNPDNAMTKDDPSNEWRIKMRSKGVGGDSAVDMPNTGGYSFLTTGENSVNTPGRPKLWYKNLGVLDEISQPVLQPLSLMAGTVAAPRETQLYVFFQTMSFIGRMGFVKLDAPCGYDFGSACKVASLPPFYYDFADVSVTPTRNFTRIENCQGKNLVDFCGTTTTKFNRARIMVGDNIVKEAKYGFQITVTVGTEYVQSTQNQWKLFLSDNRDYAIDGVKDTLNLLRNTLESTDVDYAAQTDRAFGLFKSDFGQMPLSITMNSMFPTSLAGNFGTMFTFDGLVTETAIATTLRIVAPPGFKFNGKPAGLVDTFIGFPDGTANRALWKCDAPPLIKDTMRNQLRFFNCQFAANVMYGFSLEVEVPDYSPSDATNTFIVEMGFQGTDITGSGTSTRLHAKMIDAPMVKAVRNTLVDYSSNRAQDTQKMTIDMRLVTALTTLDDGIVIVGDQNGNNQFQFTCYSETFPFEGYLRFPTDYGCQFANQRYTLYRKDQDFPAGYYKWQVIVANPLSAIPSPGSWQFGTYHQSHNGGYPNNKMDKPVLTLGFPTRDMMPDAKLVQFSSSAKQQQVNAATNRDDRPGYKTKPTVNYLIFQFTLKDRPESEDKIILRGPKGFEIADDCTSGVVTDENEVFGPNSAATWDPQFTKWASAYAPTKCEAEGNRANITVPVGLDASSTYVFKLQIQNNPSTTPDPNYWTLEYNGESSVPFEGFTLMTATGVTITPVSLSVRSSDSTNVFVNPVEFSFVPFQNVPARAENDAFGGMVRVLAPPGYEYVPLANTNSRRLESKCNEELALPDVLEADMEDLTQNRISSRGERYMNCRDAELAELMERQDNEADAERRRLQSTCQVDLRTADGTLRFVSGTDVICDITGTLNVGMYLSAKIKSSTKSIIAGTAYKMTVYLYNRVSIAYSDNGGVFEVETFQDAEAKTALDLTQVPGFPTVPLMYEWTVQNPEQQYMGTEPVRNVLLTLRMPDALYDGDEIWILAPQGFVLSVGTTGACNNFRWEGGTSPLPASHTRVCECNAAWTTNGVPRCGMTMVMNGLGLTTISTAFNALKFRIDTANPSKVVSEIGNYWKCSHMKNKGNVLVNGVAQTQYEVKSEHAFRSWTVKPQLQNVGISIHNMQRMAAEAYTDLMFIFLAVNNAVTVKIEAMQPADFKFDAAVVEGFQIDGATGNNVLVVNNADISSGQTKQILVKNVKLGVQGGPTVFNLRTFDRALLGGEMQDSSDLQDEKLSALGFRMPGLLSVTPGSMRLESDFLMNPSAHPVESMFPAREQELNTAVMVFTVSQTVFAQSLMLVTCEGQDRYTLEANGFSLTGTGSIEIDVVLNAVTGALEVQLKPTGANTVSVLVPGAKYTMRFRTTPKIGQSNWRIVTYQSRSSFQLGELPTNTNDGLTPPFAPVYTLGFSINLIESAAGVPRSPPQAEIEISLNIQTNGASVMEVIVIAPEGFDFPSTCGATCTKYNNVGVENRRSVRLRSPQANVPLYQQDLNNVVIRTITPSLTPAQRNWYVQTRSGSMIAGGMQITGWGRTQNGFEIKQMANTKLWYPSRRALQGTHFAFTFTLGVNNGQRIEVNPPILYELYCSTMPQTGLPALLPISLPGDPPTCIDSPLTLILASPLYAGTYSFMIGGDVPAQTPPVGQTQYFSLVIKDNLGKVLDAAYDIPAVNPLQEIPAVRAHLTWQGAPARLRTVVVTIGITFDMAARNVEGFLITFPPGLRHDIQTSTDVKNLNKAFPVAPATSWVDHGNDMYLRILVDQSGNVVATIPAGTYEFEFPILFPAEVPPENIWYFSLCANRQCNSIIEQSTTVIPMTFPIGGFREGEVSMNAQRTSSASGRWSKVGSSVFATLFLTFFLFAGGFFGVAAAERRG